MRALYFAAFGTLLTFGWFFSKSELNARCAYVFPPLLFRFFFVLLQSFKLGFLFFSSFIFNEYLPSFSGTVDFEVFSSKMSLRIICCQNFFSCQSLVIFRRLLLWWFLDFVCFWVLISAFSDFSNVEVLRLRFSGVSLSFCFASNKSSLLRIVFLFGL